MTPPCSAHSSSFSASTTPRPNHKSLIRTCSLTSDPCTSARRRARTRHALCCTPARERARVHSLSFARHRHHANPMCILSTIQRRSRTMTPLISLGLCTISSTSRIPRSRSRECRFAPRVPAVCLQCHDHRSRHFTSVMSFVFGLRAVSFPAKVPPVGLMPDTARPHLGAAIQSFGRPLGQKVSADHSSTSC